MIKLLIVSHPDEIPALHALDGLDDGTLNLRDGNLSSAGLRAVHRDQAAMVAAHQSSYSAVVACRTVAELVDTVVKLADRLGPIGLLDLVSHGRPGYQQIGNDVLFEADDTAILRGGELVAQLAPALAENARVRLLGCKTGLERRGRTLLAKLGLLFGVDVTVYGTIERVLPEHFETGEFSQVQELLFSSEAAVDYEAPTAVDRTRNLQSLVATSHAAA